MSFGIYELCFASNVHILKACKHLPLFYPKSWNMTSLKRHFLKNSLTDFSEILLEDVKLMPDKVGTESLASISVRNVVSKDLVCFLCGYQCFIAQCRLRSVRFTTSCKNISSEYLRVEKFKRGASMAQPSATLSAARLLVSKDHF